MVQLMVLCLSIRLSGRLMMTNLNTAGYKTRRSWSDGHMSAVKAALGRKFIAEANFKQDTELGIDLVIPTLKFAVRIRQITYSNFKDFTLRTSCPIGLRSEYDKLINKTNDDLVSPDFLFYAFALDTKSLAAGYLIDLQALRISINIGEVEPVTKNNKDGSHFVVIPFNPAYSEQIV
jgi:hypothetical protein